MKRLAVSELSTACCNLPRAPTSMSRSVHPHSTHVPEWLDLIQHHEGTIPGQYESPRSSSPPSLPSRAPTPKTVMICQWIAEAFVPALHVRQQSHLANPSRLEHLHSPSSLPSPNAPSPPSLPSLRSAPGPLLLPSRVPTPEAPPPLESIAAFFLGAFTNTNTTPSPSHFHDGRELQTYRSHTVPFLLAVFATSTWNSSVVAFMTDKLGNYVGVDLAPDQDDLGYEAMSMMAMATAKATGAAIMLLAVVCDWESTRDGVR
ncbi:hypothetical protein F5887DRAFT_1250780 [Amanita rubescens]|nr:hypothetical protein F5887DRAFT_1250780 [Amanita rubescens]